MHSSSNTVVLMHVDSVPIIEHCRDLRIGPLPASVIGRSVSLGSSLPCYCEVFADAAMKNAVSRHEELQDFDNPQGGTSPNWSPTSIPDPTSIRGIGTEASGLEEKLRSVFEEFGIVQPVA